MGAVDSKMGKTGLVGQDQHPLAIFYSMGPDNQVFPPYIYSHPRKLVVQEKGVFSGGEDTFEGLDAGTMAMEFYAKMKRNSLREKKRVYDMTGNQFCEIHEPFSWSPRVSIRATGTDIEMARMKRKGGGEILVWIRHLSSTSKDIDEGQNPALKIVRTDTWGCKFDILRIDGVVANTAKGRDDQPLIARLIHTKRSFTGKDSYELSAAAFVDMGLMMCLVVGVDELRNDDH